MPTNQTQAAYTEVYCEWKVVMAAGNIAEAIASLTPEQQETVIQFIAFLQRKDSPQSSESSPFLGAVDEFVEQHPELLRRLAQ